MLCLSRIRINPFRPASRTLLANPHIAHGAVLAGLPDPEAQRPLWRWDTDRQQRPDLLVLTATTPDWTHLIEQYGWPEADGDHVTTRDYTPVLHQLAHHREFAFRVTANPVQNVPAPTTDDATTRGQRPRSQRMGHRTAAHQQRWFLDRTTRWGFHVPEALLDTPEPDHGVPDMRITQRQRLSFPKKPGGKPVVLHTATFEGRLRITDPQAFTRTLTDGLGPAKAYGCGLLTLAPLTTPGQG